MIIFRYISRELLSVTTAVCVVLLLVLISGRFVKYLANALSGEMDPEVIFAVIGYRIPGFLELTLPLAFFLAVLLTFGRLYVENEMSILKGCGFSERKLLSFTLIVATFLSFIVGFLSLYVTPVGIKKAETIFTIQEQKSELDRVTEKTFYSLRGGKGITWVNSISEDRELENVFMAATIEATETSEGSLVIVIADSGRQTKASRDSDERYLTLEKGYRVEGIPGRYDYQITYFDEYGTRLAPPEELSEDTATDAMTTQALINSSKVEHQVALQWRFSVPVMMFIVTLLAVPLSRINPRSGRFARILPAVLLYFSYLVSLNTLRGAIEDGSLPVGMTLIPVHLVFLLLALVLIFSEKIQLNLRRVKAFTHRSSTS
ncbi:MAG: LPS export ABC transporter permease LptF [Cellvibrionales bacterium TMED47]|nr:LPS export ABC transporter permease LptF [Porticoccaceae bacterium]RPG82855.1 MAG: LPS export ABC transporter permease LptF [Cellvibrionales bacterium TMED47]